MLLNDSFYACFLTLFKIGLGFDYGTFFTAQIYYWYNAIFDRNWYDILYSLIFEKWGYLTYFVFSVIIAKKKIFIEKLAIVLILKLFEYILIQLDKVIKYIPIILSLVLQQYKKEIDKIDSYFRKDINSHNSSLNLDIKAEEHSYVMDKNLQKNTNYSNSTIPENMSNIRTLSNQYFVF